MESHPIFRDNMLVFYQLSNGNPGAVTVITQLLQIMDDDTYIKEKVIAFLNTVLERNIVGARLWYLYKNEAKLNIQNLLQLKLDRFDDMYFHNKFEKYM